MDSVRITYNINLPKKIEQFDFNLDAESFALQNPAPENPPEWTALDYKKCSHCPLTSDKHPHCPVAIRLHDLVERFHDTSSIDEVEMEIITEERKVIQKTDMQRAAASMLELILPASGCPKTDHMRPLARFHLPLASEEENIFRVTGMYLLGQYFRSTSAQGGRIEFQGLIDLYAELAIMNKAIASRLKGATRSDSVKNAITLLDMYSTLVPLLLEDQLAEMRGFFKAFLPEERANTAPVATSNYLKTIKNAVFELVPLEEDSDSEATTEKKAPPPPTSAVETILKGSKLELELMPVDDEKQEKAAEDKPVRGRATFNLPDD
ncbi:MAG: hypothetical protein CMN85_02125 [Spongiibacteraceae bacterium]|nr:hypothetical protein [Spongiibacteraceae bacterium]